MILAAEYVPSMYATVWALVPPVVAIVLALITKEVYSSLFVGIVIGGLFYGNAFQPGFSAERSVLHIFEDGLVGVLSDSDNVGILIFLVVLGVMVSMMNKAGGSAAFGEWASEHIKTRIGAQLSAIILGVLIFIDDYFNCLTVGSVMRPVTDKHQVSRAKLAYLIDATAAPVCIIAPISSWAAAVTGFVKGEDGFSIFIKAIPYNYYALFTIIAMVTVPSSFLPEQPVRRSDRIITAGSRAAVYFCMFLMYVSHFSCYSFRQSKLMPSVYMSLIYRKKRCGQVSFSCIRKQHHDILSLVLRSFRKLCCSIYCCS